MNMTDEHHSTETSPLSTEKKLEIIRRDYGPPRVNPREVTVCVR